MGVVSYLNAVPLVHTLSEGDGVCILGGAPSRVADWLRDGHVDVGLVPVVELLRQPGLELISDACVGARGPVDSVLLLLRTGVEDVRSCFLDPNSRTSQILARVILRDLHGVRPQYRELDAGQAWASGSSDAVLVIGDQALKMRQGWGGSVLDLSAAWLELTGLPFVFAVWAARPGVLQRHPGLPALLERARDEGCAAVGEIAEAYGEWGELTSGDARVYLEERIRYRLAAEDRAGLDRFLELARPLVQDAESEEPCSTSG